MAGNHTLGTIRGTIEIDYDGAGIVKAVRDTDKAKSSMDRLGKGSDKVLGGFKKFAGGALRVSAAVGSAYNALTLVAGTLAVMAPLAAAAFAAAPGFVVAYAAAAGVLKLALSGVSDALGAAGEDSAKFEKAIEKLSPEAQKFARAFRKAYPDLLRIKNAIQDAFFQGTAGKIGGVVSQVSKLTVNAAGVARAMSSVAQNVIKFATSSKSIAGVNRVLGGVRDFMYQISQAIGPVVQAFFGLAGQAGAFGKTLGGVVANALLKFASFLKDVNLADLFATALPIVKSLGAFLGDLASIAAQLFSVFNVDGASSASILSEMAAQLAAFLKSAQGQDALAALGTAIQAIAGASGQIFLALLQALAPTIVALAPGVATLANQIAGVMVPAINALNPLLVALAGFLSENMSWVGPLAGAVVALAAGYKIYAAAAKVVAGVQAILASKMLAATTAWITNTTAVVANRVAQLASAAVTGGAAVAAWIASTAAVVANRVALIAGQAAMLAVRGATIAWTAVQWLLNAALTANPIGLVVVAIAALVAGIIYAYNHSERFRAIVQAVWAAIKVAIAATVNWIVHTVWPALKAAWNAIASGAQTLWHWITSAWNGIKNAISTAINAVRSTVRSVWAAIVNFVRNYITAIRTSVTNGFRAVRAAVQSAMNAVRSVVTSVWNAIVAFIRRNVNSIRAAVNGLRNIVGVVKGAFSSARSAAIGQINSLLGIVRGLPRRVSGALGGLGSLLYSKGQALVRGFINGIASMIGAVKAKAQSVVSAVTRFLPGSPAKEGPLSGKGYVLLRARRFMNDFAQGLNDGAPKPVAALMGAVNPIARATVPSGSRTTSGASTAGAANVVAGGTRVYRMEVDGKVLAEFMVDAITGNPVTVAKANKEGSRKTAWAGSGR